MTKTEEYLSPATILVVDDDRAIRTVMRKIIERIHHHVIEAENGIKALHILQEINIDLVVSDVYMPELSGIELLDKIRKTHPSIPVIIVTGKATVEAAVECMKIGAFDYLSKPLSIEKIKKTVSRGLNHNISSKLALELAQTTYFENQHPVQRFGYEIIGKLGEGSMGVVYQVEKESDGEKKQFALKVFRPLNCTMEELDKLKKRFLHEAQAASSVKHPNIVKILDFGIGQEKVGSFILMEYIRGVSLRHYIKSNTLNYKQKAKILCQIAHALSAIHEKGIYHRDIKPANVLVDSDVSVKITDFGIARLPDSLLTQHNDLVGSPSYMAPEAFISASTDHRADIFSFGILAYELLLGTHPFPSENILRASYLIRNEDPEEPSTIDKNIPALLETLLHKMLRKDLKERSSSAKSVYNELCQFISSC